MSEIEELEARVTAAMARIGQAVETLAEQAAAPSPAALPAADPDEIGALRAQLEEERHANAQLEARVQAIQERQETRVTALQREVEDRTAAFARLDAEMQRLRRAAEQLRENNRALRDANARGVGDPSLIDAGLRAELEALAAERDVETAEVGAVLAVLGPLAEAALAAPAEADAPRAAAEEQEAG